MFRTGPFLFQSSPTFPFSLSFYCADNAQDRRQCAYIDLANIQALHVSFSRHSPLSPIFFYLVNFFVKNVRDWRNSAVVRRFLCDQVRRTNGWAVGSNHFWKQKKTENVGRKLPNSEEKPRKAREELTQIELVQKSNEQARITWLACTSALLFDSWSFHTFLKKMRKVFEYPTRLQKHKITTLWRHLYRKTGRYVPRYVKNVH